MKFKYFGKPNFNVIEVEGIKDKRLDLIVRPETSDSAMIKECVTNYSDIEFKESDIVMDLGANIGGFGKIALNSGIKQLICFEPDRFNFELLSYNLRDFDIVELYEAAVVGDDSDVVTFVIKDNKNSACSGKVNNKSKISDKVFHSQTVKAVNFDEMLDRYKPNVLKIDIEGGEYYILNKSLPAYVDTLAIELHGSNKSDYLKMFKVLDYLLEEWDIDLIDPVCVFQSLQLMNIVLHRKKFLKLDYNFSDIDNMNLRKVKINNIDIQTIRDNKKDQSDMMKLLIHHYNNELKLILELGMLYD